MGKIRDISAELEYYSKMIKYREIPTHAKNMIQAWLQIATKILEAPEHVFITDVADNGELGCEDLWLFSKHYAIRIEQFVVNKDEFQVYAIEKPITHMAIKATDYDFKDFDARSRLSATLNINQEKQLVLVASQGNCPVLEGIIGYLSAG
jgi:hypothetical protein